MNTIQNNTPQLGNMAYVYAKANGMRNFKAFDLEGIFVGSLIYASMLMGDKEDRRKLQELANDNKQGGWQFQLRRNGKVLFQTA